MATSTKSATTATMLLACALLQACSGFQHKVQYGTQDVPMLAGGGLQTRPLTVQPFADQRDPALRTQAGGFDHPAVVMRQDEDWYLNSDDHYDPPVSTAVTAMLREHLQASHLFSDVAIAQAPPSSGLLLTGQIRRFEAYRDRKVIAQGMAVQLGLIGLVTQATVDCAYEADVSLQDVRLTDTATGAVLWQGEATGRVEGESPLEPSGFAVYRHADLALKVAVQQLVDQLAGAAVTASAPTATLAASAP